jgi:hypothetical protein
MAHSPDICHSSELGQLAGAHDRKIAAARNVGQKLLANISRDFSILVFAESGLRLPSF